MTDAGAGRSDSSDAEAPPDRCLTPRLDVLAALPAAPDVALVMQQAGVGRAEAERALGGSGGDVVAALVGLLEPGPGRPG